MRSLFVLAAATCSVLTASCRGDNASPSVARGAAPAPPPATAPSPPPVWRATGFATPDSVVYDEAGDRYLVTNVNGGPSQPDNNGYISELSADGKVTKEKLIAGGQNRVTLNAPKGMAIARGVLYVTDVDTLRSFDLASGAPKGDVAIAGATFLNDVAASPDGKLYVTDSGIKEGSSEMTPTGTDAVYVVENGAARPLARSKDLNQPNGLAVTGEGIVVASFGTSEVFRLDDGGKKHDSTKIPYGGLDGVTMIGDTAWVSSWDGWAIYRGKVGGAFEVAIRGLRSPGDLCHDKKRNRVIVPLFLANAVEAYDVK